MDSIKSSVPTATAVDKYDAIYLNTPFNKLSLDELKQLPIGDLAKADASLFLWADSFKVAEAAELIKAWGFTFKTVASILNLAEKPAPVPELPKVVDASAAASSEPSAATVSVAEEEPAPVIAKARGPRVKSIQPPQWWTVDESAVIARPTTEQLWMAVRENGAAVNAKFKLQPYQIADLPELAKAKARGRQPHAWCPPEWHLTRPSQFLDAVVASLAPDSRVLELFGDSLHDKVHAMGPAIPSGYVPALNSEEGVVATAKAALEGEGKVALRSLAAKMRKALATSASAAANTSAEEAAPEDGEISETEQDSTVTAVLDKATSASSLDWSELEYKRIMSAIADHKLAHHSTKSRKSKRASRGNLNADGTERKRYGIAAAGKISPELCEFLGEPAGTEIARTTVVKRLNEYIKDNNLKQGRQITMDAKLQQLLQPPPDTTVTYFSIW